MTRLQAEWQRLYLPRQPEPRAAPGHAARLVDGNGRVRAMVLALGRPADWSLLAPVWQAVQSELGWPAPAIAVSGVDSYELWFSLEEAVPAREAHACLAALCQRHLAAVTPTRLGLLPAADRASPAFTWDTDAAPGHEVREGQWSAFIAPDLAPMFADMPWLDIPPGPEGQAELLARLRSITPSDWQTALARLQAQASASVLAEQPASAAPGPASGKSGQDLDQSPRQFLLRVMNDESVALALRIEAAKALLAYSPKAG